MDAWKPQAKTGRRVWRAAPGGIYLEHGKGSEEPQDCKWPWRGELCLEKRKAAYPGAGITQGSFGMGEGKGERSGKSLICE